MRKLIAAVVLVVVVIYSHCATFGDDNSYTCHCKNDEQCNKDNGACSTGCAIGWSGASCQKQNVAFGKPSSQIDTNGVRTSDLAVDGDITSNIPEKCTDTGNDGTGRWWRVDLLEEYPINHITIYHQSEPTWAIASIIGFSVHVNKDNQEPELCYKDTTYKAFTETPVVTLLECDQTITGRYVNISNFNDRENSRYLTLCEVEIYVCSVGTFGSDCTNFCHCLNNERCSEIGECPGRCADGWTGTTCSQKCAEGYYGDGCQKNCSNRKCLISSSCDRVRGECIGGCSDGYTLTDCSKACDNGTFGAGCVNLCSDRNCLVETSPCNKFNGSCQGGCKDGSSGVNCAIACDNGTFGAGCVNLCSDRNCLVETSPCNNINGSCQGGCTGGFSGIDCVKECEEGFYGEGCKKKCLDRQCKDSNLQCDSKTGECMDGCQTGYQSIDCTECVEGTYGQNCQLNCSARFCQPEDKVTCSKIDGACDCLDGYQGTDCTVQDSNVLDDGSGSNDQTWTVVGTIFGLIIGIIIGIIGVLFFIKRRSRSKADHPEDNQVTDNQSSNDVTQQELSIDQQVTQPSSNTSNNQDDNNYDILSAAYQNEHAYELLNKT